MPEAKFLLDADIPMSSVKVIRPLGFDVNDFRDLGMRYAADREIIKIRAEEWQSCGNQGP
jgi:predicted nuclease of predicted toxin-antitoxin system